MKDHEIRREDCAVVWPADTAGLDAERLESEHALNAQKLWRSLIARLTEGGKIRLEAAESGQSALPVAVVVAHDVEDLRVLAGRRAQLAESRVSVVKVGVESANEFSVELYRVT